MKKLLGFVLGATFTVCSAVSQAVPIVYFGENLTPGGSVSGDPVTARASFLSGLVGVGSEDFDGIASGTTPPFGISFPGTGGSITATLGGTGNVESSGGAGRFATSGSNYYETRSGFTIDFSSAISAFGFYATDIGDFGGQVTLALTRVGGGVVDLIIPNTTNAPNAALLFYGFIDSTDSYTSIAFGNTSTSDSFGFDDMVVGDMGQVVGVPLPGTLALMGIGLLGLGRLSRRRSAAK